jgi:DNA gyrase subunit B
LHATEKPMTDYSKIDIVDAVRRHPGMYIGGTDLRALHHMIEEVIDQAIEHVLLGQCTMIAVILHQNGAVTVQDNGPGMLVNHDDNLDMNCLQIALTNLGIGDGYTGIGKRRVFGGLHGVGLGAINALSEQLTATIRKNGRLYRQSYERGRPTSSVETIRDLESGESTGTSITFRPDHDIFPDTTFKLERIKHRLGELAYLFPDVTFSVQDERSEPPDHQTFHSQEGVADYLRFLNRDCRALHEVISDRREISCRDAQTGEPYTLGIDFALQVTDRDDARFWITVNGIPAQDSRVVKNGLRWAVLRMFTQHDYYDTEKWLIKNWQQTYDQYPCGLTVAFSIRHPKPIYESPMRSSFANPEVEFAVATVVFDALKAQTRLSDGRLGYRWTTRKFCCEQGVRSALEEIEEDEDDLEQDT